MSSINLSYRGDIKFISILDKDNNPIFFFNFNGEEKEIEHEYQIFASLEIFNYKIEEDKKNANNNNYFIGLLLPLYEDDNDLGSYGFKGSNNIKIILIKNLDMREEYLKSINNIELEIYEKYIKLIMNPFFDKSMLDENINSNLKSKFFKDIEDIVKNNIIE
jgi:hypothetical protein